MFSYQQKVIFTVILCVSLNQAKLTYTSANLPDEFIVNGGPYGHIGHVALIVSLINAPLEHGWLFTGSLISPQHILTVAQAAENFHRWHVGVGSQNRGDLTFFWAEHATIHPNFNSRNLNNNLALLHLTAAVPTELATPAVILPDNITPSLIHLFYGFGSTDPNSKDALPNTLHQGQAAEFPLAQCQAIFGNQLVTNTSWCSTPSTYGLCYGDQGGPLVHFTQLYIVGIASFWMPPCASGRPNVFVRLSAYRDWIHGVINEDVGVN
ncbi:hypothetical protein DMENIID0001_059920 [Sergentomyia squamirostris]